MRRPFPPGWHLNLKARPQGRLIFLRRTNEQGAALLLGHTFALDPTGPHRLVRAEVDWDDQALRFFALRRREPTWQLLLREVHSVLRQRRFTP